MALTLTTADSALKEDYQPAIREQLNNTVMLLQQIEQNSKDVEGRRAVLSLHVQRNSGVGARAEGGTLPTAGNQGYAEERVPLRYNYGVIKLSGPVLRAMKSDTGSFVRALDSESKGIVTDLRRTVNRQGFGTSDGKIAQCASAAAQVITLTTPTQVQLRQIEVGAVIDVGTVANRTLRAAAVTVSAVDLSAGTVTVVGTLSASTTTTDFIFQAGLPNTAQAELTGLQTIVTNSASLFNVDPATYPTWKSTVDSNSGTNRAPSENLFTKVANAVAIAGGAEVDFWVTSDGVHRGLAASLQSQKRFVNTVEVKGGYKGLAITAGGNSGEVGVVWDRDNPSNKAFGLTRAHITQHQMSDWEFMNEDGAILSRVTGEDTYQAVLFKYHEITTDQRNAHARIDDLTES